MNKIISAALEVGMLLLLDNNDKVSADASVARCITHALKRECHTLRYASRNLNLHNLIAALSTLTATVRTLVLNDTTLTLTCWTYALRLHASEE
mgnify:CR=1 FL=1